MHTTSNFNLTFCLQDIIQTDTWTTPITIVPFDEVSVGGGGLGNNELRLVTPFTIGTRIRTLLFYKKTVMIKRKGNLLSLL